MNDQTNFSTLELLKQLNFLKDERDVTIKRMQYRDECIRKLEDQIKVMLDRIDRLEIRN